MSTLKQEKLPHEHRQFEETFFDCLDKTIDGKNILTLFATLTANSSQSLFFPSANASANSPAQPSEDKQENLGPPQPKRIKFE